MEWNNSRKQRVEDSSGEVAKEETCWLEKRIVRRRGEVRWMCPV